jgi:hypothetical protein
MTGRAMRALTVRQPWAGAIAHQTKRVENRSWRVPAAQVGAQLLIHAGTIRDREAVVYGPHLDVYGAVVALARVTGCHWSDDGTCCDSWGFARAYHWQLADVQALAEPVPAKGRQRLWRPDDALLAAVRAQLAGAAR